MGVNNGGKLLSKIEHLSFAQLYAIASRRASEVCRSGSPDIALDLNWVIFNSKQASVNTTVTLVKAFITKFVDEGIHVHVFMILTIAITQRRHPFKGTFSGRRVSLTLFVTGYD